MVDESGEERIKMIAEFTGKNEFMDVLYPSKFKDRDGETYYSICNYCNRHMKDEGKTPYEVMRQALLYQYKQNEDLAERLRGTGNEEIVYLVNDLTAYAALGYNVGNKDGDNVYGQLLMVVRELITRPHSKVPHCLTNEEIRDIFSENYTM